MGAKALAMAVLTGMAAGYVAGFTVAEIIYADERHNNGSGRIGFDNIHRK